MPHTVERLDRVPVPPGSLAALRGVFCDIDDTLTWHGRLVPEAFAALHRLREAGLRVVPVTGRPGGWVDQIARTWPVDAVVGENGGLWFYVREGRMVRRFERSARQRAADRARLRALGRRILAEVPGSGIASDQPYRELDLAIDWCEDVPRLAPEAVAGIVRRFHEAGASCKVSSIHVNGWYGDHDKLSGCRRLVAELWGEDLEAERRRWAFFGDSANDEPMFAFFPFSVGVANVRDFLSSMKHHPAWITSRPGGAGFAEGAEAILAGRPAPGS